MSVFSYDTRHSCSVVFFQCMIRKELVYKFRMVVEQMVHNRPDGGHHQTQEVQRPAVL